jgi:hypothetical protein
VVVIARIADQNLPGVATGPVGDEHRIARREGEIHQLAAIG